VYTGYIHAISPIPPISTIFTMPNMSGFNWFLRENERKHVIMNGVIFDE